MCAGMCIDTCIDLFMDMCMDIVIHMCVDMHIDMCMDMCVDMCTDMFTDMCTDMCTDTCTDMMCTDMCTDMCTEMCTDMFHGSAVWKLIDDDESGTIKCVPFFSDFFSCVYTRAGASPYVAHARRMPVRMSAREKKIPPCGGRSMARPARSDALFFNR